MSWRSKAGSGRACAIAILLLTLASEGVSQQIESSMPLYQVHGSGTSNPALLIWRVMDLMMARTKPKIAMSYRSIGSGAGGTEFAALTSTAFGSGDVPISKANFNTTLTQGNPMMHVPFLVGSVSIFHNVPGIGEGLFLSSCTLAKIFRGAIVQWNDSAIISDNPGLPDLKSMGINISVVHRNNGSSSTYALTHYLARTCSIEWDKVPGSSSSGAGVSDKRDVGVTTQWPADAPRRWTTVLNSQGMVEQVASVPYSLGYVESGQGLQAGLEEVAILNADGVKLTSSAAEIASEAFIRSQFPLSDLTSRNWTDVNPVYASSSSSPNQWPLTLGTYLYLRTNLAYLAETGSLLRLFVTYLLSDDVAALMPEYGFIALPKTIRGEVARNVSGAISGLLPPTWSMEEGTNTTEGPKNFVFSPRRDSYLMNTLVGLTADSKETKSTLKLGDAYQVHGSGSFVSALLLRHAQQILQGRARVPISMTYRAVGSVEAQQEFGDYANMYMSYNHFKVGDMPLASTLWTSLNSNASKATIGAPLQLPFAISALGIYHTKAVGRSTLALDCTLLARLFGGNLTSWADEELRKLNSATATIADERSKAKITVFAMAAPSGATYALTGYLAKSCKIAWGTQLAGVSGAAAAASGPVTALTWPPGVTTTFQGANITTPEQMLAAIAATPNAIGYLPSTLGSTSGLEEAQLLVGGRQQLMTSAQADLSLVVTQARNWNYSSAVFASATADMATVLDSLLYGQDNTWPMPMVQYLYMYRNLSGYGYSGPLLRAFVEFILPGSLTAEGSRLVASSGLTPMPADVQQAMRADLATVTLKTLTVAWDSEGAGLSDGDAGAALYTFSANRESYDAYALSELQSSVAAVQGQLATGLPAVLQVACTADTYGYIRLLRADVQDMASSPIRILDEMGTAPAIVSLLTATLGSGSSSAAATQLIVHPGPLSAATWMNMSLVAPVLQIPASIRPVALLYKGVAGLKLGLCTLAKIINLQVTSWDDPAIQGDNPGFYLPSKSPIKLLAAGADDGDVLAVVQYIQAGAAAAGCSEFKSLALPAAAAGLGGGDLLAQLTGGGTYTGLAFLAASSLVADAAAGAGLQAAALRSTLTGTYVTPLQTPQTLANSSCGALNGCPNLVGQAYTAAVEGLADSLSAPYDPTGDWSGVRLAPLNKTDVYPVVRFDFLVVASDVSKYGADGAALQGVIKYATHPDCMDRMQQALAPYFAGLGPKTLRNVVSAARDVLRVAPDAHTWAVTSSSTDDVTHPATTIVLRRAPSLFDVALEGSLAGGLAGIGGGGLGAAEVTAIAQSEAQKAAVQYQQDRDKLDLTYQIAVAALVLGLVLSVLALALALYALAALRGGGGGAAPRGCLSPAGVKYEVGPEAPAGGQMEMRMLP